MHVQELLHLGVTGVYLAMDSDSPGQEATVKVGHLFQTHGVEVWVVEIPAGKDPDAFLRQEGPQEFANLLRNAKDFLTFLVKHYSKQINLQSPAGKTELIQRIGKEIQCWNNSLMVHESLKKLAKLTDVPEEMMGIGFSYVPNIHLKKSIIIGGGRNVDHDFILESDFLRWLLLFSSTHPHFFDLACQNLPPDALLNEEVKALYTLFLSTPPSEYSLLSLASRLNTKKEEELFFELQKKKINSERAEECFLETIQKILERNWMRKREAINLKIQNAPEEEALLLTKEFDEIRKPQVQSSLL